MHTEHPSTTVTGTSQNGVTYQPTGAPGLRSRCERRCGWRVRCHVGGGVRCSRRRPVCLAAGAVRPGAVPTSPARHQPHPADRVDGSRRERWAALSRFDGRLCLPRVPQRRLRFFPARGGLDRPARRVAAAPVAERGASGARGSSTGSGSGVAFRQPGREPLPCRRPSRCRRDAAGQQGGERDSGRAGSVARLVYDQDWLGDDDVAPGVLD